jgi:signal transduction histidine kinase/ActR/RegA family two-component response regulator
MDVFVPEKNLPETIMMIEKVQSGEKFSGIESLRYNKEGGIIPVRISGSAYRDQEGNLIGSVVNLRDIRKQKKMETQLQQAHKMEALGTLAGGIAHDFNNLLMGIQGRTSLMRMDNDSSHSHNEHLKGIEDYVKSAGELTKQLLGFARGGKYEIKPTDLNKFIKKQNRMFGRTRKEITIRGRYEKNLWTVDVDQGQIEQVLLNIFVNAWHAMPGGGNLYIQTENIVIDEFFYRPYHVEPGKYVKISATDTGEGMDNATQQRIFDPFFTTKEMGRGTGLGLASVYGIIKNHGGFINVYSEKGEGTTFNIYLPASEKEVVKENKSQKEVLKGAETTLLVDDEDIILDVGPGIIEKLGYEVLIAKSGKEAIGIYEKNHDRIDMVILDMIMPEMGGGETYDKLKEINPGIKVLLSSGYSIDGEATKILERGCNDFIQKPFNMIDLSRKLRKILDEK